MPCPNRPTNRMFVKYIFMELPLENAEGISKHIQTCESCRSERFAMGDAVDAVRELLESCNAEAVAAALEEVKQQMMPEEDEILSR